MPHLENRCNKSNSKEPLIIPAGSLLDQASYFPRKQCEFQLGRVGQRMAGNNLEVLIRGHQGALVLLIKPHSVISAWPGVLKTVLQRRLIGPVGLGATVLLHSHHKYSLLQRQARLPGRQEMNWNCKYCWLGRANRAQAVAVPSCCGGTGGRPLCHCWALELAGGAGGGGVGGGGGGGGGGCGGGWGWWGSSVWEQCLVPGTGGSPKPQTGWAQTRPTDGWLSFF